MKKLLGFILVGAGGFVVDGGVLTLLSQVYGANVYLSRLVSFSLAALATWALNRALVFREDVNPGMRKTQEYGRYFAVQACGALTNLLVFSVLLLLYPQMKAVPIVPLFIGAFFGLVVNFSGARWLVFNMRTKQ